MFKSANKGRTALTANMLPSINAQKLSGMGGSTPGKKKDKMRRRQANIDFGQLPILSLNFLGETLHFSFVCGQQRGWSFVCEVAFWQVNERVENRQPVEDCVWQDSKDWVSVNQSAGITCSSSDGSKSVFESTTRRSRQREKLTRKRNRRRWLPRYQCQVRP